MTRAIRSFNKGRLRIWWVHHRQEAIRALQLVTLVALLLAASTFDHQDQLEAEQSAKNAAIEQLASEREARGLPRVTFVIDAATVAEAKLRLAEIEGATMVERYKMRGVK